MELGLRLGILLNLYMLTLERLALSLSDWWPWELYPWWNNTPPADAYPFSTTSLTVEFAITLDGAFRGLSYLGFRCKFD
jgi:hypothetical protein